MNSSQIKNYVIAALILIIVVMGLVWIRNGTGAANSDGIAAVKDTTIKAAAIGSTPPSVTGVTTDGNYLKGNKDAKVTIIEFSDFQCPFCERFVSGALPQIEENYIKTGKVKLIFKDFPLDSIHPYATPAALAARCAGEQGKFWEMHDLIFTNQASLSSTPYRTWATQLGLDTTKFNDCVANKKYLSAIRKDTLEGQQAGVRGTPAFLVNGQLISGAQPFPIFQQAIEAALR